MPSLERLAQLGAADRAAIVAPLDEFTESRGFRWQPAPLALALRDGRGEIVGGLIGQLHWEWLRIEILAVAATLRGQGWGRRLMEEARRFGELPDYPSGQVRPFFAKVLA